MKFNTLVHYEFTEVVELLNL